MPATVEFADVAGLVRGAASATAGSVASTSATCARPTPWRTSCAASTTRRSSHLDGRIDPVLRRRDRRPRAAARRPGARRRAAASARERAARVGEKSARDELGGARDGLVAHLDEGLPARTFDGELPEGLDLLDAQADDLRRECLRGRRARAVAALTAYARERGAEVVAVAARFEAELAELDDQDERDAFLRDLGLDEPGMPRLARACYRALGLISFFTAGPMEARAWTVREGRPRSRPRARSTRASRAGSSAPR